MAKAVAVQILLKAPARTLARSTSHWLKRKNCCASHLSRECQRDEKRRGERGHEHDEIKKSPKEEFEHANEPALSIHTTDRQEDLGGKRDPNKRDDPSDVCTGRDAVQGNRRQNNQDGCEIGEA